MCDGEGWSVCDSLKRALRDLDIPPLLPPPPTSRSTARHDPSTPFTSLCNELLQGHRGTAKEHGILSGGENAGLGTEDESVFNWITV